MSGREQRAGEILAGGPEGPPGEGWMGREIAEQPALIRARVAAWEADCRLLAPVVAGARRVAVVGRGSSGHAGVFFTYLYGLATGRQAVAFRPWLATQASAEVGWDDTVAIALSVSGESTDVAHAARWMRDRGARVVGITNRADRDSALGQVAHDLLRFDVGDERAVPATKTFMAQLFLVAGLCSLPLSAVAGPVAAGIEDVLRGDAVERVAAFLARASHVTWVARGPALAAARDAALKLQESAGQAAAAYSSAEIQHGPIGALGASDRVVLIEDSDGGAAGIEAVAVQLLARDVPLVVVGACHAPLARGHTIPLELPAERWAGTPVFAALAQAVALELARRRGRNPDAPMGLRKVTRTL